MATPVGGFKTAGDRAAYEAIYDRLLEQHWPVPRDELAIETGLGTTRVRRSHGGDGTPLLMVHPTAGSSVGWYPLIESLSRDRDVYTPDTIGGCGRSVQRSPITSVGDLVAWLDEVIDQLELTRLHLLGYSEGAWIAGNLAARSDRRDRLASVTLVEAGGSIERIRPSFILAMVGRGMVAMASRDRRAGIARFNTWMNGDVELTDVQVELLEASMGTYRQRLPTPRRLTDDELRRLTAPVLLLIAQDTKLYDPMKAADRARALVPDVTVDITPDAGHGLLFQYPDVLTSTITGFLVDHD